MKTTIDNRQKVFYIYTSTGESFFCNLKDVPEILNTLHEGYYSIYFFFNGKLKKASKKMMNDFFTANQIEYRM